MTLFIAAVYTLITSSRVIATVLYSLSTVSLPSLETVDGSVGCGAVVSGTVDRSDGMTNVSASVSETGSAVVEVTRPSLLHEPNTDADIIAASSTATVFFNTIPPPVIILS